MDLEGLSKPQNLKCTCLPNNRSAASVLDLQNGVFPHSSSFFIIYSFLNVSSLPLFSYYSLISLIALFLGYVEDSERQDGC
jgi:hypothetical protein